MHNFSKLSWNMRKFSFHSSELWTFFSRPVEKLQYELVCPGRIHNLGEIFLSFPFEDFEMVDEMILWIILFFILFKSEQKSAAMHNSHKNYLSNIRQVSLFYFQHQTLWKNNRAIQNIYWACLNVQLKYGLWIYFLFLLVKIKTVQKISQFSCFHYTSACFETYPIDIVSLSKALRCESYTI